MKKYDSYKDSGVDWLGVIPEHWEVKKLKHIFNNINSIRVPLSAEERGKMVSRVYDYYGASGVIDQVENYLFDEENILIGEDGANLLTRSKRLAFIASGKYWVNNHAHIIKPKTGNIRFFCELLEMIDYSIWVTGSAQPKLTQEALMNIQLLEPPIEEQTIIANYLDHKTTQIDHLIAKKEQFIQLLEEERVAVINQAVTKGLPAEERLKVGLAPKVPMKDSGIEWLGEIPEHWEVKSFRFCIDILTDYTANGSFASLAENVTYYDSGYSRLVRLTDLRVDLSNEGLYVDEHAHNFLKKSELFGGEILIANVGAYAGLVMQMPLMEGKFTLGPNMFLVRLNQNTEFFLYQLNAPFCTEQLKRMAVSSAQPKLNKENIRQLKVVTPPIEEQNLIANHILIEKNRIETIITKTQQEIELLKEYKTALISEVVTGKVDVSTSLDTSVRDEKLS